MTAVLGSATAKAAANIIKTAMPLAANLLDCNADALTFSDGFFF